jgi:uncharacterized protein DUF2721
MAVIETELLEALASTKILAAMITPAVLISACGTLIFSTSGRLGRLYDRVNNLKTELEGTQADKMDFAQERLVYIERQLDLQRIRAGLIQKSLAALYTATLLFIATSLAVALNLAYGSNRTSWIPTLLALAGGLFLFAASALLLYESRYNLRFIQQHLDFTHWLLKTPPKSDR